jgi:hypothetical protein
MRFRKLWLAKINIAFTNRITNLFAGCLPGEKFLALRTLLPLAGFLFQQSRALYEKTALSGVKHSFRSTTIRIPDIV